MCYLRILKRLSVRVQYVSFWLLIGARKHKFSGTNQKLERRRPFETGLVRHCPQGLFSPFFTFLRAIFSRPFRLSLALTICPWVSEDVWYEELCWSWKVLSAEAEGLRDLSNSLYHNQPPPIISNKCRSNADSAVLHSFVWLSKRLTPL